MSDKIELKRTVDYITLLWIDDLKHRNALNEHTEEILACELGLNTHDIAALKPEDTI